MLRSDLPPIIREFLADKPDSISGGNYQFRPLPTPERNLAREYDWLTFHNVGQGRLSIAEPIYPDLNMRTDAPNNIVGWGNGFALMHGRSPVLNMSGFRPQDLVPRTDDWKTLQFYKMRLMECYAADPQTLAVLQSALGRDDLMISAEVDCRGGPPPMQRPWRLVDFRTYPAVDHLRTLVNWGVSKGSDVVHPQLPPYMRDVAFVPEASPPAIFREASWRGVVLVRKSLLRQLLDAGIFGSDRKN